MITSAALAILLALTWLVSDLAVRRADPAVVAAGRSAFSALGLCLLAFRGKGALRRSINQLRQRPLSLGLSGLLGVSIYALGSLTAISLVGVTVPNLLLATTPCLSLLIGVLFFRKRTSWPAVVGVVAGSAGAVLFVTASFALRPDLSSSTVLSGVIASVVAVIAIAAYGQHYARLAKGHDPLDLLPGIFGIGTLVVIIFLVITGQLGGVARLTWLDWGLLALLGVGIYVPVYVLQHQLIHLRGAVFKASISLVVPFLVRFAETLLGAPPPTLFELATMIVCVAGVALVIRHPERDRDRG
ncbi:DMT family transporter [Microlunatus parietis]|uniref:Drug/metabolite transporter (DMT)-like permease n=1 Tax=Microlunatus parietis TaxID=682979 RepID=A0A7Y9LDC5_9ACTN|nr:DMT family transporter [Microlunatus parietis]NYE71776.1 drug/metabolite transporter (DMT)-like permease [Microlunatus parietis]